MQQWIAIAIAFGTGMFLGIHAKGFLELTVLEVAIAFITLLACRDTLLSPDEKRQSVKLTWNFEVVGAALLLFLTYTIVAEAVGAVGYWIGSKY